MFVVWFLAILPISTINFNELRKDLKQAEERVGRLRQEIKELQNKRDESFLKLSPPPYVPPSINKTNAEFLSSNIPTPTNRGVSDTVVSTTTPLRQEVKCLRESFFLR